MTIEKLKSGSYRITQMEKGKRYRITVDHKPTHSEAMELLYQEMDKPPVGNADLETACKNYIKNRKNVISPSTVKAYNSILRNIPKKYGRIKITDIRNETIQEMANYFSSIGSPKTVRNKISFILAVLAANDIKAKEPTMPQMCKNKDYIPTAEDVTAVFVALEGSKYEIPITLAAMGLRRSEICALTINDLNGKELTINKAMVEDENHNWVIKPTKTLFSDRTIELPDHLCDLIRERGEIYSGYPGRILHALYRAQKKANVPRFQLHKLRHFCCSYMVEEGFTYKQIQEALGWSNGSKVMKAVYEHAMNMDKAKTRMANVIGNLSSHKKSNG